MLKYKIFILLLSLTLFLQGTTTLQAQSSLTDSNEDYVIGEILVKFQPGVQLQVSVDGNVQTGVDSLDDLAQQYNVTAVEPLFTGITVSTQGLERIFKLILPNTVDVLAAAGAFGANAYVEYAEPNYIYYAFNDPPSPNGQIEIQDVIPNDPLFSYEFTTGHFLRAQKGWTTCQKLPDEVE